MKKAYQDDPQKQEAARQRHFNIRLNVFFFSAFIIFTVIIVRLAILQFVDGPSLQAQESSLTVKKVPLPPTRGTIYDAAGVKLAYSTPQQSLYITLLKDYSSTTGAGNRPEIVEMAKKIANVFNTLGESKTEKVTVDQIVDAMDLDSRLSGGYAPRRLKSGLTDREVAYFLEHKSEFPGVDVIEESVRNYDKDTVAVQAIGYIKKFKGASTSLDKYKQLRDMASDDPGQQYTDNEDVGFDGLEYQYQDVLRGKNGYKSIPVDPRNMADGVAEITPPEKGDDLHLNINKNIQLKTEQAIMDQLDWLHNHPVSGQYHPNAQTGFAVAMEVNTGKVVAMASMPDYDPNVWGSGGISPSDYEAIQNVYLNGTIRSFPSGQKGVHPESVVLMGSTIKPLSVMIGLNEGLFTTTTPYNDTGIAYFGKNNSASVRNSQGHAYGYLSTPADAIRHSSNTFMVDMVGERMWKKFGDDGITLWDKYMKEFGLGVLTGVDLPNEYKGYREYVNEKETSLSRLAYASFGQQGKYTTMQLAQYAGMLATRGKRMEPQLVDKITDSDGNVVQQFTPKVLNTVKFKDSYWNEILKGMATDVHEAFNGFPYDFARKTGTSTQTIYGDGKKYDVDNGVFIAFAPRENPKLAVAVVIPEGGFGAYSAAPVARQIFDAYDYEYGLDGIPKKTLESQKQTSTENGEKTDSKN
ncbi:peptidoglycan D,D-transpeptidase FtsI family protein [Paenibacillus physcomitrellae]|uniref:Penicillin-binding protein 2 n=1 Tax=Paenibacillus physcomitrellae TaxID=1619311 RepID=A0ABQ1G0N9_9BACL|nr:penicillin-binding transpeptidase domain-containing protein [Paenibacillus physcomitrellae]GGA35193.1 penicillin-binding protein 2 [Paenibacillus physcomitrellae]